MTRWQQPGRLIAWGLVSAISAQASAEQSPKIETLTVYGHRDQLNAPAITNKRAHHASADVARLFDLIPGANTNDNGAISGQIQYRGLAGPRMDVRISGMRVPSGGPNWMDPPTHYVPPGLLENISLHRGISSIAAGNVGGQANANWKQPVFTNKETDDGSWQNFFDLDTAYRSVDRGHMAAITAGGANDHHKVFLSVSDEAADEYEAGNSRSINGTEFERSAFGVGYGWQNDLQELSVSYHKISSDDAGTPSLPLDIVFFDTELWQANYRVDIGEGEISLLVAGTDVDHRMANFVLRPAPDVSSLPLPPFVGDDARFVNAESDSLEVRLQFLHPLAGGNLTVGIDWLDENHDAVVRDPDFSPFFVNNFSDNEQQTTAVYAGWETDLSAATSVEFGLRYSELDADTGSVDAFPARLVDANPGMWPMGTAPRAVFVLREQFNARDRSQDDTMVDWVAKLTHQFDEGLVAEVAVARKSRAPLYIERYLWIPLEVNAGLGDGNNYVGDPNLDPEVSHQIDIGVAWQGDAAYFNPRVFYHRISDYIQGVASTNPVVIAVSTNANGDPTPLTFANVDAELYGFDVAFGYQLSKQWRLDGNADFVRGRRRDISDNLYRVAPASVRLGLSWQTEAWQVTAEQVIYAKQDKRSRSLTQDPLNTTNSFAASPGYALTNLFVSVGLSEQWTANLGVENLFDKRYEDPLSGFNRNAANGVEIGSRLPGRGRNLFVRTNYRF